MLYHLYRPDLHRTAPYCSFAKDLGAFINLESTGSWGPDLLFQHTGDWTLQASSPACGGGRAGGACAACRHLPGLQAACCLLVPALNTHSMLCVSVQAYARSAPRPRGTTLAQDFFDMGGRC